MSGMSSAWINPDIGNQFQVIPQPAYQSPKSGKICRNAELIGIINGKQEKLFTTACQNLNGQWQLQN
jgi:surface antigen